MSREALLQSALALKAGSFEAIEELAVKQPQLVSLVNQRMENRPDIAMIVGEKNIEMMRDNHKNHARFVYSILKRFDPEMLVDTVLWVFSTYKSHGFKNEYWSAQLGTWMEVLENSLSWETFTQVRPLYDWFLENTTIFAELTDEPGALEIINTGSPPTTH